jgi:hypothetical protein
MHADPVANDDGTMKKPVPKFDNGIKCEQADRPIAGEPPASRG